jgi:DNA polymerase III delta subunit
MAVPDAERLLAGPAAAMAPLTIAAGDEAFLRDRVLAAFRAGAQAERSEFLRLEGDDLTAADLAIALGSISLFGDLRRIWIREGAKMERAAETALLEWAGGTGQGVRVLLTTARDVADLSGLSSLAEKGTVIACAGGPSERLRWGERLLREAGLRLPGGALEALATRTPNLLALSREIEKLSLLRNPDGTVPPSALGALSGARGAGSASRWAAALLAGDAAGTRAEAATLDAEGAGGSACLWAVAERALSALEPPSYGFRRERAQAAPSLSPREARRVLHAVYRADLALKRGEVRDKELRDYVEREIRSAVHA